MILSLRLLTFAVSLSFLPSVFGDDATRAKYAQLAQAGNGVIKLNSAEFEAITASNRDWSVAVVFTALGNEFKCAPCHTFDPNYRAVAKAWSKVSQPQRDSHFFASLDFADGQTVFRSLGLTSAPAVTFYPALKGHFKPKKTDTWSYDFNQNLFDASSLAEALSHSTPIPIPYKAPLNYGLISTVLGTLIFLAIVARFFWMFFSSYILSRWTWALFTIAASLVFTSGFMFTRIRNVPFAQNTHEGPQWIAAGYSNQFGAETWVVSTLYGTLGLSQIALIILVPRILKPQQQRIAIYIWTAVTVILYSVLISLFRLKHAGYPFHLLF
ncbi:hypothetical protein BS47DRAFT_1338444 [Hydnum rufescens UP504]|uniref:Dolichyl-diphosphooligosaccharide-protein glycotransferase n=1 Tax=Hydnum rufescens UP504 TaxID=1448309 RepID=A0A9P6B5N3_9AGAM|nr:hypothetical protein BS47DRAFT_1338444 [Hydnum rufescens UP504]